MIDLTLFGFTKLGVTDYEFGKEDFLAKRKNNYYHLTTIYGNYHMIVTDGTSQNRYNRRIFILDRFGGPHTTENELLAELVRKGMEDVVGIYRKHKIDILLA